MDQNENKVEEQVNTEETSVEEPVQENMKDSFKKKLAKKDEEITKLKEETEKWKNDYYRLYADMDNLRKEIKKDHNEAIKYRLEGFISDLLTVLDSFEIALKVKPSNDELKNYLIGFQYVETSLLNILGNEGVQVINPAIDTQFDESTMQAVDTIESEGNENLVKEVMLKGYKLHNHLVRPAMVKVSKHKKEENAQEAK